MSFDFFGSRKSLIFGAFLLFPHVLHAHPLGKESYQTVQRPAGVDYSKSGYFTVRYKDGSTNYCSGQTLHPGNVVLGVGHCLYSLEGEYIADTIQYSIPVGEEEWKTVSISPAVLGPEQDYLATDTLGNEIPIDERNPHDNAVVDWFLGRTSESLEDFGSYRVSWIGNMQTLTNFTLLPLKLVAFSRLLNFPGINETTYGTVHIREDFNCKFHGEGIERMSEVGLLMHDCGTGPMASGSAVTAVVNPKIVPKGSRKGDEIEVRPSDTDQRDVVALHRGNGPGVYSYLNRLQEHVVVNFLTANRAVNSKYFICAWKELIGEEAPECPIPWETLNSQIGRNHDWASIEGWTATPSSF